MAVLELKFDGAMAKAMLSGFSEALIEHLQAIPRATEADGSEWIDADHIAALIEKLRA